MEKEDAKPKRAPMLSPEARSSSDVDEVVVPKPKLSPTYDPVLLKPSLSSLVALQQANGSWSLTTSLTTQLGKELGVVEDNCPSGCSFSMWATALALGSLKVTYASQQDKWELVAKKAKSWLKNQPLPSNLTLKGILSDAQTFLQH